jgi:hypothetical protein
MTGQRPEPPALAIRLLHFCVPSHRREALLGDLIEKFDQRGSSRWFWREVFIASLLSISASMRPQPGEILLAVIGTTLVQLWWRTSWWRIIWQSSTVQSLCGWGVGWPFPLSVIYDLSFRGAIFTAEVLVLLAVFWSAKNAWRWASIRNAILTSFLILTVAQLMEVTLPRAYGYVLGPLSFFLAFAISIMINRKSDAAFTT